MDSATKVVSISSPKLNVVYSSIPVGAGEEETRPVALFDVVILGKQYKDIKFSIGDRSQNEYPCLLGKEFIEDMDVVIDVAL